MGFNIIRIVCHGVSGPTVENPGASVNGVPISHICIPYVFSDFKGTGFIKKTSKSKTFYFYPHFQLKKLIVSRFMSLIIIDVPDACGCVYVLGIYFKPF
ncbi:hypothetical protein HanRHA438_Chr02g0062401 [Helianthus annuus]|nr:hypothetical protein HanRHA438_Chr02g0062401 [Helianthus annuus]